MVKPTNERGGPGCACHECQGIHCMLPHPGHSHREGQSQIERILELLEETYGPKPDRT